MRIINKTKIIFYLTLISFVCTGQTENTLKVTVNKEENSVGGYPVYNLVIKNEKDTTVCILHSIFFDLTSNSTKGLAVFRENKDANIFSLRYSVEDTLHSFESLPYRAECILPYQMLQTKIVATGFRDKKDKKLIFEYLYEPDFCYKSFIKAMRQMTTWYLKYKRYEKDVDLPL